MSSNADVADALTEASRLLRTLPHCLELPSPGSAPGESGVGHSVRSFILEDRTQVAALQEKLESLQDVAQRLTLQCRALDDEIKRASSPICWIPPEILCYIFMLALPPATVRSPSLPIQVSGPRYRRTKKSTNLGPWLFGQVCHYWRTLALSFPSLWTSIVVSGKIGMREMERLDYQLDRSGKAALDVLLWFTPHSYRRGSTSFHEFLQRLVGESSRWRTIRFELDTVPTAPPELDGLAVPLLEEVIFSGFGAARLKNYDFFKDAPKLQRVVLSTPGTNSVPNIPLPWAQITTYKATYPDGLTHFKNLSLAANLVDCDIDFRLDAWDEPAELPDERIYHNDTLTLPHLRRLVITRSLFLDSLVAPALTELHVHGPVTSVSTFLRRSACTLTHLTLFLCDASSADVIHVLHSAPSITALAIDFLGPASETKALIEALARSRHPTSANHGLCPNLTSLSWGDRNDTIDRAAFADMVESRSGAGSSFGGGDMQIEIPQMQSGNPRTRLRFVGIYLGRLGMKANGRRLRALEGMDVVILNARKGKPAMERWRDY
ncbi:hypothetical protein C8R43DRAFT_38115 [Mycena crocata]|nr:hypothetical protein C8R43DRAFT_38115 [Mycena crocata]